MSRRSPFKRAYVALIVVGVIGATVAGGGSFGPSTTTAAATTTTGSTTTTTGGGTSCTVADATGCLTAGGTYVAFLNPTHADNGAVVATQTSFLFNCTMNILQWAQHLSSAGFHQDATVTQVGASPWPVHVSEVYTNGYNPNEVGVKLTTGCVGQGDPTKIDLVIDQPVPVSPAGIGDDAVKIDRGAGCPNGQVIDDPNHNGSSACPGVNIAGQVNCGPVQSTKGARNHQDGIQVLGGTNIGIYDVRIGDWANELFTCEGDGAGLYINAASPSNNNGGTCDPLTAVNCANFGWGVNYDVQRMVSISCIHGVHTQLISQGTPGVVGASVNGQNSTGTIRHSIFRSNRCANNTYPGPIDASGNNYAAGFASMCNDAPGWDIGGSCGQGDVIGDRWKISSCGFSPCPGFDPANDNR